MMKTEENLKLAFANESKANLEYRAFANKAKQDGFPNIARLFRLSSRVERIHAQSKLNVLNGIGSTLENIKSAFAREINENRTMYPSMLKQAVSDNHKAKHKFENDIKSKKAHAQLYFLAMVAIIDGKDLTDRELFLCPLCGNILSEMPEKNCSICRAPATKFIKV
jgi:rubrerythrin